MRLFQMVKPNTEKMTWSRAISLLWRYYAEDKNISYSYYQGKLQKQNI